MKKIVTLALALLLSLSLTVPALAEVFVNATLSSNTYNDMVTMGGNTTVEKNAVITCNNILFVSGSLTVESGASLTANGPTQIIEDSSSDGSLTIRPSATVTVNKTLSVDENVELTIGGRLDGSKGNVSINKKSVLHLLPGGEVDVVLSQEFEANNLVSKLLENGEEKVSVNKEQTKDGYHVTAHGHDFVDGVCAICDYECKHETKTNGVCDACGLCFHEAWTDGICDHCGYSCPHEAWTEDGVCAVCGKPAPSGFTLSQGNLWIVGAGAGVILAVVAAVVIHKKKKG